MIDDESLLELRLQTENRHGLLPLLNAAQGTTVGGAFKVERLLAIGRQSFVFTALDPGGSRVVVKQPAFDYRRPVIHTMATVEHARNLLKHEFRVLSCNASELSPRCLGWFIQPPIVPAATDCFCLATEEAYLVMEFIDGDTIHDLSLTTWRRLDAPSRESAVCQFAVDFVRFWSGLHAAGWYYADLSPKNLMVARENGKLRVLDLGSCVLAAEPVILPAVTPAYCTPMRLRAFHSRQPVPGTVASMLPSLAKVLLFALTLQEPLNGRLPDISKEALAQYTHYARRTFHEFLTLDERPDDAAKALDALTAWQRSSEVT